LFSGLSLPEGNDEVFVRGLTPHFDASHLCDYTREYAQFLARCGDEFRTAGGTRYAPINRLDGKFCGLAASRALNFDPR
jgi:hypothetical protein